jgi:hypothetical protein
MTAEPEARVELSVDLWGGCSPVSRWDCGGIDVHSR